MKHPLTLAALALAVTASTAVLPAASASATTTEPPECPDNSLCVWSEQSFQGEMTLVRSGGGCVNPQHPIRSAESTWLPGGGIDVVLDIYSGKDCTGKLIAHLGRGVYWAVLPGVGLSADSAW
jgi:hypothetical protein